jgi:hypothetical protein
MPSSDYLKDINKEILDWIDSKDEVYGLDWLDKDVVPLSSFALDLKRKAHGISKIVEAGNRNKLLLQELLDLLGYAYLFYYRVKKL